MRLALDEAAAAAREGEVPVGAVVTRGGEVLAVARNRMRADNDPTAHAEMVAMRAAAARIGDCRLDGCDLWVTLEPCAMCAGAVSLARISRLYFGAPDPKGGAILHGPRLFAQSTCHHAPEVYPGIAEGEAGEMLRDFFKARRG
ncbi:MAG: tRNA(adenine34) deaminase [Sphingomonadales bacterium]|jgi:tRNA(adenine34) deaminase|nr:tRNA(adenine34) deaminase [Sphingomonadales bacterium]